MLTDVQTNRQMNRQTDKWTNLKQNSNHSIGDGGGGARNSIFSIMLLLNQRCNVPL